MTERSREVKLYGEIEADKDRPPDFINTTSYNW